MLSRLLVRVFAAVALLALVWLAGSVGGSGVDSWIRPVGGPHGPVRILQFYATTGLLVAGEKAKLCYGVENAKAVHISPRLAGVVLAASRCLEIVPERTTHYTIMAEGFDGAFVTRFFTLVVEDAPETDRGGLNVATLKWDRPPGLPFRSGGMTPMDRSVFVARALRGGASVRGRSGGGVCHGRRIAAEFRQDAVLDPVLVPPLAGVDLHAVDLHAEVHVHAAS